MPETIGKVVIHNTRELIGPNSKICMLVYAPGKFGKTTLGKTLNDLTLKVHSKPSLFVACEAGEGGGTMSIREAGVDYVIPTSLNEVNAVVAGLYTDSKYGGVVVDSASEMVRRFLQPYAMTFPERAKVPDPRRSAGVPVREDYQTMGEEMRKLLNRLIGLTVVPNLEIRKHLLVTALLKERLDDEGKVVVKIHPDLPGAMADVATAMFQTVATVKVRPYVEKSADGKSIVSRTMKRSLITAGDGVWVLGDRTGCFPAEGPCDLVEVWEKGWVPVVNGQQNVK